MRSVRLIIFFSLFICVYSSDIEKGSDSPYILESESLPEDLGFMPTLGNGELGFTIFGDSIFVNGIYNGKGGLSHRARLPNVANISVRPGGSAGYTKESFKMDLYNGIFERKQSNSEVEVTVRIYPHRFFNRAIINEIFVQRTTNTSAPKSVTYKCIYLPSLRQYHHNQDFRLTEARIYVVGRTGAFIGLVAAFVIAEKQIRSLRSRHRFDLLPSLELPIPLHRFGRRLYFHLTPNDVPDDDMTAICDNDFSVGHRLGFPLWLSAHFSVLTTVHKILSSTGTPRALRFLIDAFPGRESTDFTLVSVTTQRNGKSLIFCLQTKEMENPDFQSSKPLICFATNACSINFDLAANETSITKRIVMALGETSVIAAKELDDVEAESAESLLKSHSEQWNGFWDQFHIDLEGNLDLSRTINAGIFYLASSLPSLVTNQKQSSFYGLSPTGLGRGNLDNDYQGHNFWDTEIWMLPVVTQLSTDWTRQLLSYRFNKLTAALDNAKRHGNTGTRFPWESAQTGTEVTNPCCPEVAEQQIHITADIAFAARHYFAVTNNTNWMQSEGCELLQRIAEFWVSRVSLDQKTGQYNIKYVMGPDEDHENVTNNGYTNLAVHHSLEFVHLTQAVCGTDPVFSAKCMNIAEKLKIPYDAKLDYHPQYEGYTPDVQIKQADAVLLSYPMLYPMNVSTLSNNLKIYERATRASGPAMTWSMHAIGHLDEGNQQKAMELFEKGYKDYVREPFKVWSEVIKGKEGAVNFITGVGGFMQAVINGYGGVRFHSDRMEVKKPYMLPGTRGAVISGIKYQGSIFRIKLSSEPSIRADYIKPYATLHLVDDPDNIRLMIEGIDYPIKKTIFVKAITNK